MIRAWLIRPLPLNGVNRVKEFKENGFVAIGWPKTGSLKGKTKEEIRALISQPPYSYAGVILGNYTATIDIFVNQMRVGDLLLMPNGEDIHLGQIVGDYDFDPRRRRGGVPSPAPSGVVDVRLAQGRLVPRAALGAQKPENDRRSVEVRAGNRRAKQRRKTPDK